MPEGEFSYVQGQSVGVEQAFPRVDETTSRILGFNQSVDSLERVDRRMAGTVARSGDSRPTPPAEEEGKIMVVTADNKSISVRRPPDQCPVGNRRKEGEKANTKQMATMGTVCTVDPKLRTVEEVACARSCEGSQRKRKDQPAGQHKRV